MFLEIDDYTKSLIKRLALDADEGEISCSYVDGFIDGVSAITAKRLGEPLETVEFALSSLFEYYGIRAQLERNMHD